ncbi:MAG: hypothetical protein AABP62_16185 [Planctomycetota bacterium]
MESKKFLTAPEVATEFGLDEAALQQFVDSGEVRALADRGIWKYRRDELQTLIDSGKIAPPTAEIWLDEGASTTDQVLTVGTERDDDLSYIELDEEALAEHATMISKSGPVEDRTPVDEVPVAEDWFVPSNVDEMKSQSTDPQQSSRDVKIYSSAESHEASGLASADSGSDSIFDLDMPSSKSESDSDVRLAGAASDLAGGLSQPAAPSLADSDSDVRIAKGEIDSDSDVRIADDVPGGMLEGSGIVLDFDLGAGATVSSSGSSLRLPQTGAGDDTSAWDEADAESVDVAGGSGLSLSASSAGNQGDSAIRLSDDDSAINLYGQSESGIALDGDSRVGAPSTGSSVLSEAEGGTGDLSDDSGLSLEDRDDSGLSLESLQGDSGLTLEAADSGLTLEAGGDSGIRLASPDKTLADDDFPATMFDEDGAGRTQTLDLSNQLDDDSSFDVNLSGTGATAEIQVGDDDDFEETAATVVKRGRGKAGPGLTEAFQLDDAPAVEDLDIADDLDAVVGADDDEAVAELEEEEVFEASDETFSDEIEAADEDDEEYLAAAGAAAAAKTLGPREPSWGTGMSVGLIACSLVLAANALILWSGVSTMWSGAEASGPASALIAQLAGLL